MDLQAKTVKEIRDVVMTGHEGAESVGAREAAAADARARRGATSSAAAALKKLAVWAFGRRPRCVEIPPQAMDRERAISLWQSTRTAWAARSISTVIPEAA